MGTDISSLIQTISVMALPVILAVVLHEVAHGYVAWKKGDDTARRMGRLTLNPIAHIDPFGTVLLPILFYYTTGFLFAYAKPVPVNFFNLRDPKKDMVWVAAAGPATNIVLAVISALLLKAVGWISPGALAEVYSSFMGRASGSNHPVFVPIIYMLYFSVGLNVILAVINLIPVPPADGGRIAVGLLPDEQARAYSKIEPYGLFILIFVLLFNDYHHILDWTIRPLIGAILGILL
ncbi:MAG: site-2 protease family protein [Candidatus Nitrospinota bacterium M3_3B_026]